MLNKLFASRGDYLCAKISASPESVAPYVLELLQDTDKNADFNNGIVDLLNQRGMNPPAKPDEVEEIFVDLCRGIQYVHENYNGEIMDGTSIGTGITSNKGASIDNEIAYLDLEDKMAITTDFLQEKIKEYREEKKSPGHFQRCVNSGIYSFSRPLTNCSLKEHMFLLGAEEAFHAHQNKRIKKYGFENSGGYHGTDRKQHYAEDLIELEAGFAMAKAIQDLGMEAQMGSPFNQGTFDDYYNQKYASGNDFEHREP